MKNELQITILHELPGRLRVFMSHPLKDAETFGTTLQDHEGIEPIRYTRRTQTVLVYFDPAIIQREELLVRMALAFSLEHGYLPVEVNKKDAGGQLTAPEAISGGLLLASGILRSLGVQSPWQQKFEHTAGGTTAAAVLLHGVREMRTSAVFHPELLSLAYLAVGILRGRGFQAAVFTWFTAFGRHLMEVAEPAVCIQPTRSQNGAGVSVSSVSPGPARSFLQILPALARFLQQAGKPMDDMLANLREISKSHDHVLDALGPWKRGIPMQFQTNNFQST